MIEDRKARGEVVEEVKKEDELKSPFYWPTAEERQTLSFNQLKELQITH